MYKSLFEKLQSKKPYFQNKLKQYENNIKNTWKIMKVIIGKSEVYNDNFPKILNIIKISQFLPQCLVPKYQIAIKKLLTGY